MSTPTLACFTGGHLSQLERLEAATREFVKSGERSSFEALG